MRYVAGLDLAQRSDYTCLAIAERVGEARPFAYEVVYVRRWRGTSYVDLVGQIGAILRQGPFYGEVRLRVDATGVGQPVLDIINQARALGEFQVAELDPIIFSAGQEANRKTNTVPKKDLVGALEIALTQGRLKFASDLPLARTIKQELKNFTASISSAGRARFEASGSGHDDIVVGLALCVYEEAAVLTMAAGDYMGTGDGTGTVNGAFVDWEFGWRRSVV